VLIWIASESVEARGILRRYYQNLSTFKWHSDNNGRIRKEISPCPCPVCHLVDFAVLAHEIYIYNVNTVNLTWHDATLTVVAGKRFVKAARNKWVYGRRRDGPAILPTHGLECSRAPWATTAIQTQSGM
jgi:hypothetical protein